MHHEIQFTYLDTPSYLKGKEHCFKLIKRGNSWYIADHNDGSNLTNNIIKELHAGKRIEEITKNKIQDNRHDLEEPSKSNEREIILNELDNLNSNSLVTPLAYTAKNLNRAAAIKYARDYALKNNPSPWGNYPDGDCTNFVSIALYMGGMPKDDVGANTWYWNSASVKTASWTAARYLRPFLLNNKGSSSTFGVKAVSIDYKQSENADVISFHNVTRIGHSAIVTSYKTDDMGHHYGQTVCQHSYGSAAALDYPLSSMVADYGSSNVYAAWIVYIYK